MASHATSDNQNQTAGDPLAQFGAELRALIRGWSERTGGRCEMTVRPTFIDKPPVEGFRQSRGGPLMEINLMVADMTRADELLMAHFQVPVAVRMLIEHTDRMDDLQTDRVDADRSS
jgi:hypothetical protein